MSEAECCLEGAADQLIAFFFELVVERFPLGGEDSRGAALGVDRIASHAVPLGGEGEFGGLVALLLGFQPGSFLGGVGDP
ncbi:hypothetical protein ACH4LK_22445 [Streptomyces lydicus]|uniref:hypothetical protein n=1 Tax=Streptomyces lydicus TaxID=47763 RepID=UPI0037A193E9